jgi:hypothetical protein
LESTCISNDRREGIRNLGLENVFKKCTFGRVFPPPSRIFRTKKDAGEVNLLELVPNIFSVHTHTSGGVVKKERVVVKNESGVVEESKSKGVKKVINRDV